MATAYRVIQRGLRPDGTPRKPLRVKEGYVPPDEAETYVPPHKMGQINAGIPTRLQYDEPSIEDNHLSERPKTRAQIKNERKNKNKREKKLVNDTKHFDNSETTNDLFTNKFDLTLLDDDGSDNGMALETAKLKKVQPSASSDFVVYNSRDISSFSAAKKGSASQQNETNEDLAQNIELEKQQRKLIKKLEQIEKLVKKGDGLNAEEVIKIEKKGAWDQEIIEIENQLRALKTK